MTGDGANGSNGSQWAALFTAFHDKHRDKAGKKLKFTAVFNAAMDAFVSCLDVPLEWRLLAWIWRYSWGNNSDWCLDKIGGELLGQKDAAAFFGVSKQRLNNCLAFLRDLGFVHRETGHRLYPVDNPAEATGESPDLSVLSPAGESPDLSVLSPALSNVWRSFCDGPWKYTYPVYFDQLASAEAKVSHIKKVRLGHFHQWKRTGTLPGASLYTTSEQQTVDGRSVGSLEEDRPTDPPRSPDELLKLPAMVLLRKKLKDTPRPKLRAEIIDLLQGAPLIELDARIILRFDKIASFGMVRDLARDVGTNFAEFEALRKSDGLAYQERSEQMYAEQVERIRREWNSYTEEEREWYRKNLPEVVALAAT